MKTIIIIIAIAAFAMIGNDPIGSTMALTDWDGFPEYNFLAFLVWSGCLLVLAGIHRSRSVPFGVNH